MYRAKTKRIRELIDGLGEYGLAKTSQGAQVSVSFLEKLYAGTYKSSVREPQRERLSKFFKVREEEIFDRVRARETDRAS